MENRSCNFFSNSLESCTSKNDGSSGGQNNNLTPAWNFWQLGTSNSSSFTQDLTVGQTFDSTCTLNSFEVERLVNEGALSEYYSHGERQYPNTDHHLMCLNLNLGKRRYTENNYEPQARQMRDALCTVLPFNHEPHGGGQVMEFVMNNKRGRHYFPGGGDGGLVGPSNSYSSPTPVAAETRTAALVPRCQVEGCHVALVNAKAYHRRHKVCEMHAKAPKVVVLGLEQRFCQQCSRFHSVSEFDESKRSCRRRLAGHNERRRKSSQDHYANTRNLSQGNYRHLGVDDGRALSLLSSKNDSWISKGSLPARCSSGTISELIAENRASTLAQQIIFDKDWQRNQHQPMQNLSIQPKNLNSTHHNRDHMVLETHGWGPMNDAAGNLTLNLMHFRNSEFGFLSGQQQPKEGRQEEEECQQRWNSHAGTHIS